MKLSIISVAALSVATCSATPVWGKNSWKGLDAWKNGKDGAFPFEFTSTYEVVATPDQVVNGSTPTGGLAGCKGYYDFGINSKEDYICWNIVVEGFRGEYQSPARTATHIHEAAKGKSGPPRLSFPNPVSVNNGTQRFSRGCMTGPFTTGVVNATTGVDSGAGFKVAQIEANPSAFFSDVHSSLAVPGAIRGQLA